MHTKYGVSTSNGSKVIANVKVDNRQTDRQTDKQTDRTKTICPRSFDPGRKKVQICYVVNRNEDFLGHFLYKFRTLVVQRNDFSWIYELTIYELGL